VGELFTYFLINSPINAIIYSFRLIHGRGTHTKTRGGIFYVNQSDFPSFILNNESHPPLNSPHTLNSIGIRGGNDFWGHCRFLKVLGDLVCYCLQSTNKGQVQKVIQCVSLKNKLSLKKSHRDMNYHFIFVTSCSAVSPSDLSSTQTKTFFGVFFIIPLFSHKPRPVSLLQIS